MQPLPNNPLVTIVTPSFNQAPYIEATICSVLEQDYAPIEYLVIDGGSTDGTLAILERYAGRLTYVSEPDGGQADAINKGMRMARGQIRAWLNSDDCYTPGAVRAVVETFRAHPDWAFLYGDALAIDAAGRPYGIRAHVHQTDQRELVEVGDYIVQPAAFWRAELWDAIGALDASLHYALDYEYWMRAAGHFALHYVPVCLAIERLHGGAKTTKGALGRIEEIEQVARRHGGAGLPASFRGEGAAGYTLRALQHGLRGRFGEARRDLERAAALRPPPGRYLSWLATLTVLGGGAVPSLWLQLNRGRQGRKVETRMPADYTPAEAP